MIPNPFSLTPVELRIFNEILARRELTAGDLIKRLGIHKGTAYNSIRRMLEKGILSCRTIKGVSHYLITPILLKELLHKEEEAKNEHISQIKKLIQTAEINKKEESQCSVEVLIGDEGFKSFFKDLYDWANKTKKEYLFMGKGNEMVDHFGEEYYQRTQEIKKRLKLRCRAILNAKSQNLPIKKHVVGTVKYIDMPYFSPVSTWIYGDKTAIVIFGAKPLNTVIIDSKLVADSYRNYFELVWKSS